MCNESSLPHSLPLDLGYTVVMENKPQETEKMHCPGCAAWVPAKSNGRVGSQHAWVIVCCGCGKEFIIYTVSE